MKFKLDENLGLVAAQILREPGHDVSIVIDQKLQGAVDQTVYDVCLREQRCLVTLDLDFANVLRFSPEPTAGIVVQRFDASNPMPSIHVSNQTRAIRRYNASNCGITAFLE